MVHNNIVITLSLYLIMRPSLPYKVNQPLIALVIQNKNLTLYLKEVIYVSNE